MLSSCVTTLLIALPVLSLPALAQTVETSQQVNQRITALASSRVPAPHDYVIGSGDVVAIQVFDVPELSRDLRVSQGGTIGIPLVPVRLRLAGLTETQAERKIEEVLEANGLVSHPEVTVAVKEKKSKPITVVGAVGHPTVYQADRQVTLIEVLAEAGGIAGDAGDSVIITRPVPEAALDSSEPPALSTEDSSAAAASSSSTEPAPPSLSSTISVNLSQILESGDMKNNIVVLPGDVVTVPHAGIVYVLGAVVRPGGFVVSNDRAQLTTLKVLSLAGGLNRTAKSDRAVIVRKDVNGQQHEVEVDLKKVLKFQAEDVQLRPSDILYVPNSGAKQALVKTAELSLAVGTGILIYRLIP